MAAGMRQAFIPSGPFVTAAGYLTEVWSQTMRRVVAALKVIETLTGEVTIDQVPTILSPADEGLLVPLASGFNHLLYWNGLQWEFAAGDGGNRFYRTFPAGLGPQEAGWAPCDGTTVHYLVVGGAMLTTAPFTTPVVANQYFRL